MNMVSNYGVVTALMDGDSLSFELRSTEPLVQYIKKGTSGCMPDWETTDRKPVIYPNVMSQLEGVRMPVADGTDRWTYNSMPIGFNSSGVSVTPASVSGKFQRVKYNNGDFEVPGLRITGNLATAENVGTDRIGMSCDIVISGFTVNVTNEINVRLEETVGDPYQGHITATDGGVIDDNSPFVILTAELMIGGSYVNHGVDYRWFRAILGGWEVFPAMDGNADKVRVTGDDVDTFGLFRCEFRIGGLMVFAASITVSDETDPLILVMNPSGPTELPKGGSVTYRPKVVRRSNGYEDGSYSKFSFTTYVSSGAGYSVPSSQIVANKQITITRTDVDNAGGELKIFIQGGK